MLLIAASVPKTLRRSALLSIVASIPEELVSSVPEPLVCGTSSQIDVHEDSSYTSHESGDGRWRHRSALECGRFSSPLGILRAEDRKSGVSMAIPHDERDLEAELHRFYVEGGKLNPPYWARRFYQLFTRDCVRYVGGVEAVRRMMATGGQSSGMEVVKKHGRLDLAVETLVLKSEWTHLFNDSDRWVAKRNLSQK